MSSVPVFVNSMFHLQKNIPSVIVLNVVQNLKVWPNLHNCITWSSVMSAVKDLFRPTAIASSEWNVTIEDH
jgi:hypothetical protein